MFGRNSSPQFSAGTTSVSYPLVPCVLLSPRQFRYSQPDGKRQPYDSESNGYQNAGQNTGALGKENDVLEYDLLRVWMESPTRARPARSGNSKHLRRNGWLYRGWAGCSVLSDTGSCPHACFNTDQDMCALRLRVYCSPHTMVQAVHPRVVGEDCICS